MNNFLISSYYLTPLRKTSHVDLSFSSLSNVNFCSKTNNFRLILIKIFYDGDLLCRFESAHQLLFHTLS